MVRLTGLEKLTCEVTAVMFGYKIGNGHSVLGIFTGIVVYFSAYALLGIVVLMIKNYSDGDGA